MTREIFKKTFPDVENIVDPLTQMREKITLLKARGGRENIKAIELIHILAKTSSSIGNIKITEVIYERGKVRLRGETRSLSNVDAFERKLKENNFKDVRLARTQKSLKEELYDFEFTMEL